MTSPTAGVTKFPPTSSSITPVFTSVTVSLLLVAILAKSPAETETSRMTGKRLPTLLVSSKDAVVLTLKVARLRNPIVASVPLISRTTPTSISHASLFFVLNAVAEAPTRKAAPPAVCLYDPPLLSKSINIKYSVSTRFSCTVSAMTSFSLSIVKGLDVCKPRRLAASTIVSTS